MGEKTKDFLKLSQKERLMPQEEMLETAFEKNKLIIGIPKELSHNENRIALVPEAVHLLVENGHRVIIEEYAGASAHFINEQYAEAGAEIVTTSNEVYKSDVIIKIGPPTLDEIEKIDQNKVLFSSIFLPDRDKSYFEKLMSKRVKAISYEFIQDKTGGFPVIKSMSEIIGNTAVLIASEYLSHATYGRGIMLGGFPGIKPTEVVIIGAGTVAEFAARTALGMGAYVKVFDNSIYKLRSLQNNLGNRIFTSIVQPKVLLKALKEADVVISATHSDAGVAPCYVSEEMVQQMHPGSIIVDVSIDQGGCFETSRVTTHEQPVFQVHGITHYCVPNIASRVPHTASYSLSNFLTPLLLNISETGGIERFLKLDPAFSRGVYIYNGVLTNKHISDLHQIPFRDLELLMAAFD
ncbi:MAG: alanine dehydrogenase [Marinilabiliales bacterium]|nr:MAG: alanine dehydrogenase [Marinilabiliales bacterium]